MPSRKEFLLLVAGMIGLPVVGAVLAAIDRQPYWAIFLIALVTLLVVMTLVFIGSQLRGPRTLTNSSPKELMDRIDDWLGDQSYSRKRIPPKEGTSHTIEVVEPTRTLYVSRVVASNIIQIFASHSPGGDEKTKLDALTPQEQHELNYQLNLELARFGSWYSIDNKTWQMTVWVDVPITETFNESGFFERFNFVRRADQVGVWVVRHITLAPGAPIPSAPQLESGTAEFPPSPEI